MMITEDNDKMITFTITWW